MLIEMLVTLAARFVGSAVDPINWILAGAVGVTRRSRPWILLIGAIFACARTAYVMMLSATRPAVDLAIWWLAYAMMFSAIAFLCAFVASRFERSSKESID